MRKPLVLVVDDDYTILDTIASFLPLEGFAYIGIHALCLPHMLFRDCPDIIILDVMLRGTSGIEYAQSLRRDGVLCPLVAMSASRQMEKLATESGLFADVLAKPFDYLDMVRRLRALL